MTWLRPCPPSVDIGGIWPRISIKTLNHNAMSRQQRTFSSLAATSERSQGLRDRCWTRTTCPFGVPPYLSVSPLLRYQAICIEREGHEPLRWDVDERDEGTRHRSALTVTQSHGSEVQRTGAELHTDHAVARRHTKRLCRSR